MNWKESGFDVEKWFRRARAGDQEGWDRLVEQYQALVYSVARRTRLADEDCDDVFQFTFVTLFKNLDRIEDGRSLPKWLAVTAAREALRVIRTKGRETPSETLDQLLRDEEDSAQRLAEQEDETRQLHEGLSVLDGKCKTLLTMLYVEERSYQDVEATGIPIGSIGPTRSRCLEKLRRILTARGFAE